MEDRDTNCDTEYVTLEGVSLEPHVVRRKRSLVSVIQRRLVRSLNEVEVCRYQDEEEENGEFVSGRELYQSENLRSGVPTQNRDRCRQKRKTSFNFCSTKEIRYLYCNDNSQFQYNPMFMTFAAVHQICRFSKTKYNTLV